jgi:phosphotriesterase-related protein
MSVTTVLGPIEADSLGVTLAHEHIFIDLRNQFTEFDDPEQQRISHGPITLSTIGVLRRNPYAIRDNLLLDDLDLAEEELGHFTDLGGRSVVDCTSIGIARRPDLLKELAIRTGLNIVAGCGYYTQDTHPPEMDEWSAEQLADQIVRELIDGIEETGVRAGVIGEIGTSDPIHPAEEKNLTAAAIAFRKVPAAIYVHTYPWAEGGLRAANLLIEGGVAPAKVVICHTDVEISMGYMRRLLDLGVFLEFDDFGKEYYIDPPDRGFAGGVFARDIERVRVIKDLVARGFERQILITNDICLKSLLHAYGGWGYDHILKHVVPMLEDEGIPPQLIETFLIANPGQLLDL